MKLTRIKNETAAEFAPAMRHYAESFPAHEQRLAPSQSKIMLDGDYHFAVINSDGRDVGALLYWETEAFIYVEHFYIYPEYRGLSYGGSALRLLTKQGKTVILEIDPPQDAVSIRRQSFYEKNGFAANKYPHVHPPYRKGSNGHSLVIMSFPHKISQSEYDVFKRYLDDKVMSGAQA